MGKGKKMNTLKSSKNKKVLFITHNIYALSPNGIPSDIWLELPLEMNKKNIELQVMLPFYSELSESGIVLENLNHEFQVFIEGKRYCGSFYKAVLKGITIIFVKNDYIYGRLTDMIDENPETPDNLDRLSFFNHAVFAYIHTSQFIPDIVHCVGWETGLFPVLLKKVFIGESLFQKICSVFCLYNFASFGNFEACFFPRTGLPWTCFNLHEMEFWGKFSFIKGGIVFSDGVVIMGEKKIERWLAPGLSLGLHGVLEKRKDRLWGVEMGVDYLKWNPTNDSNLDEHYSQKNLEKKKSNRKHVLEKFRMDISPGDPLVLVAGSLMPLVKSDPSERVFEILHQLDAGYIVLGHLNKLLIDGFKHIKCSENSKWFCIPSFDIELIHFLLGGVDLLLIPFFFEPLPLIHLYAMRYGTIPIISELYGITEGIQMYRRDRHTGNGFYFYGNNFSSLLGKLISSINAIRYENHQLDLMKNAMAGRYKWDQTVTKLLKIYELVQK